MQFFTPIQIAPLNPQIQLSDKIMLIGSCFTEHIGNFLHTVKFNILQNPHGILFDPISTSRSIIQYIENKQYTQEDLFYLNEAWHSWEHHSRFSNPNPTEAIKNINQSQQKAHDFLKNSQWLIITLGSAFSYRLVINQFPVANCHKAPGQTFHKHLCSIEEIITSFDLALYRLFKFNPNIQIIFTISPVRHLRDGVIDNNRSKARLIEAVHHLVNKFDKLHYFPSYELIIDVLRDYRFYDIDLAHPNFSATNFVLEKFTTAALTETTQATIEHFKKIHIAQNHKPFNPNSEAHQKFKEKYYQECLRYQEQFPYLDFSKEMLFFKS